MRPWLFGFVGLASCSLLFRSLAPECNETDLADCAGNTLVFCQDGFLSELSCEEERCLRDAQRAGCVPLACGDGTTTKDEECDDGNNASGDGCSFDCLVEACLNLPPLSLGITTEGDTSQNEDNFEGSCINTGEPDQAFTLLIGGDEPGRLRLVLFSKTDQALSVRLTCHIQGSELGCVDQVAGGDEELLEIPIPDPKAPLTVIVHAFEPGDDGPFFLSAVFLPDASRQE